MLLPGFELQTSNVSKQQTKTPAKRRTGEVTASNVSTEQIGVPANRRTPAYRRTGGSAYTGESAYRRTGEPAYQIPTFNTTDWYTGESAYRRIRFQRSTQQIGTPANRRTGVSDSNPLGHRQDAATGDDRRQHGLYLPIELQNSTRAAISAGFYRKKVAGYWPAMVRANKTIDNVIGRSVNSVPPAERRGR